jgi:nitroreductase
MNMLELSAARFSARKYTNEKVTDEDLKYIFECVRLAPSAVNRQPWKFVLVKSDEAKQKVQKAYPRDWFYTAPIYILAYRNKSEEWVRKYDNKPHGDIDVTIALEHLALAATERGLGTCWVCAFNPEILNAELPQAAEWEPVAIMPIGHIAADCPRQEKSRKPLDEIIQTL